MKPMILWDPLRKHDNKVQITIINFAHHFFNARGFAHKFEIQKITMMNQKALPMVLLLASLNDVSLAQSLQCSAAKDSLQSTSDNAALTQATKHMWKSFENQCADDGSCVFEIDPISATTHLNFGKLKDTDQYAAVKQACADLSTDESPTTLCTVNSRLTVSNGAEGTGAISDKFVAKKEPVCFPLQCEESQVDIVHAQPLGCDPDSTECDLKAETAVCPDRGDGAGSGNCHKFSGIVNNDQTLTDAITALSSKASLACVSFSTDDDEDPICTSQTDPIKIKMSHNTRSFESHKAYNEYMNACYDANGQTCYMSMSVKMQGEVGFFSIDMTGDYNDYPVCLPEECMSDEKIEITSKLISNDVGDKVKQGVSNGFEGGRRLEVERFLQRNDLCPAIGMDVCDFTVMDFYCVARGAETGILTMASSDASTVTASFAAAMGMVVAGGMLL